jgi:hypothetical protein
MTEELTKNETKSDGVLGIISLIMGAGGVFLSYYFVFRYLTTMLGAQTAAARECRLVAPFFIPLFAFIGIAAGILWLVASVGFFQKKQWSYPVAIIAVILALFASLWPNIPAMESRAALPGPWFLIFFPNLVVYFYLVRGKGQESRSKTWLGLGVGMAFILNYINGIASTTRMVNRLAEVVEAADYGAAEMYMLTMPGNMIASILFGIAAVGLFLAKKKEWVRIVGLAGTFLSILAGFPLALYSMFWAQPEPTFSMFFLGPIVSTFVGFFFLSPKLWKKTMKLDT